MQKNVYLCLVALVTSIEFTPILGPLSEKCCPRGGGNFINPRNNPYPINEPIYRSTGIAFCSENQICHEITTCQISATYGTLLFESPPEYLIRQTPSSPEDTTLIPTTTKQTDDKTVTEKGAPMEPAARRKKRQSGSYDAGDGDVCCETEIYASQYNGTSENAMGEDVYLLCLPSSDGNCDQFQFVTEGTCIPGSVCSVTGKPCTQEYAVHTLLAYKPGASFPYMSFEPILIPSYCSCKNLVV